MDSAERLLREIEVIRRALSHDLRAPVRHIEAYAAMLLKSHGPALGDEGRESLERIRQNSLRMRAVIEGLLDLERVSRLEPRLLPVDLSSTARAVLEGLQRSHPQRRARFVVEPGLSAAGDPDLLESALGAFLENAWKFTAERPEAVIEVGREKAEAEDVFYVTDNGAGFDPALASKLFRPFQRLHTVERFPGVGAGLAVAARIIERHKGRVWAEAVLEQGAVFRFALPKAG